MIIISENLSGLAKSLKVCEPSLIEDFSIQIKLDRQIRRLKAPHEVSKPMTYGSQIEHKEYFQDLEIITDSMVLGPHECLLACSQDVYTMPPGYFGLIQTKGSLARMFVSATANDGQVEPGYSGKITLELINHSPYSVAIRPGAVIAQIFIIRCSSEASKPYQGRYQGAIAPTLPTFY